MAKPPLQSEGSGSRPHTVAPTPPPPLPHLTLQLSALGPDFCTWTSAIVCESRGTIMKSSGSVCLHTLAPHWLGAAWHSLTAAELTAFILAGRSFAANPLPCSLLTIRFSSRVVAAFFHGRPLQDAAYDQLAEHARSVWLQLCALTDIRVPVAHAPQDTTGLVPATLFSHPGHSPSPGTPSCPPTQPQSPTLPPGPPHSLGAGPSGCPPTQHLPPPSRSVALPSPGDRLTETSGDTAPATEPNSAVPPLFKIMKDPSGRARCSHCGTLIPIGTWRFGKRYILKSSGKETYSWQHMDCSLTTQARNVHCSNAHIAGWDDLPSQLQREWALCLSPPPRPRSPGSFTSPGSSPSTPPSSSRST